MQERSPYRVIGLWQVWDDLPDAPAPSLRPPEAILERIAGTFDHYPSKRDAEQTVIDAGAAMRDAFENREILGHLIVDDARWALALKEGGWLPEGIRRHAPGGRHLRLLALAYDLPTGTRGREIDLWAPAPERHRPRAEDVAANLRNIGDSIERERADLDLDGPFFPEREREPERQPRRRRSRDRDMTL